jgi:hypothetical protein
MAQVSIVQVSDGPSAHPVHRCTFSLLNEQLYRYSYDDIKMAAHGQHDVLHCAATWQFSCRNNEFFQSPFVASASKTRKMDRFGARTTKDHQEPVTRLASAKEIHSQAHLPSTLFSR